MKNWKGDVFIDGERVGGVSNVSIVADDQATEPERRALLPVVVKASGEIDITVSRELADWGLEQECLGTRDIHVTLDGEPLVPGHVCTSISDEEPEELPFLCKLVVATVKSRKVWMVFESVGETRRELLTVARHQVETLLGEHPEAPGWLEWIDRQLEMLRGKPADAE